MAAPQSAPPHRIRERNQLKKLGVSRSGAGDYSSRHGDMKLEDVDVSATSAVADANCTTTENVNTRVRCMTAPPVKHSVHIGRETSVSRHTQKGFLQDSRTHSRTPNRTGLTSGRKTINRSGRKSYQHQSSAVTSSGTHHHHHHHHHRAASAIDGQRNVECTSDVDGSHTSGTRTSDILDFGGTDIYNDNGWDTDLEGEEDVSSTYDRTGKAMYLENCKQAKVIPASYFLRHMFDSQLEMKHHGLGPEGIKPLAIALVSNTHVLRLNLTDNWLGPDGGRYICEMLKENCFITECDLSDNRLDHVFAERFVDVVLNNNTLTRVTLSGNNFDDKAAVYLAEAIMTTCRIEYLNLSRNHLAETAGNMIGPALAENTSIRELDISWNSLRRKGAVAIAQGIRNNTVLQKINISWNGFGNEGAKAMGDALKVNTTLEDIDISNNRITTEGAVLLGKGISANDTLKRLKIGKNPMQSAGCYAICAAIARNPNCTVAELDFTDIMVNSDFQDIYNKVKEQLPDLRVHYGGDVIPKKPKARIHPMVKLQNYIAKHNLKLLDFFNKFDTDGSMSVSREEFTQGIQETGIKLTDEEIEFLLEELDKDGDGEINYSEMVMGHQDFTDKERKMAATIMQYKR